VSPRTTKLDLKTNMLCKLAASRALNVARGVRKIYVARGVRKIYIFFKVNFEFATFLAQAEVLKTGKTPDFYMAPQPLPETTEEGMEFDVNQLDPAGKRYFGGLGWSSGHSAVSMPPGVAGAEATASGGASFARAEPPAKKAKAAPKNKKKFSVGGVLKIIEGGDHKKMSEFEMQTYEAERAKDMRGDWPVNWPPSRIAAVKAAAAAARGGVDYFFVSRLEKLEILSSEGNFEFGGKFFSY